MTQTTKPLLTLAVIVFTMWPTPMIVTSSDGPVEPPGKSGPVPVVVELFTSEGCSSCPPADVLLAQLQRSQPVPGVQIIILSQHVDYWNDLGWSDPFSSPVFTERQAGYGRSLGQGRVYTPQMIVDGSAEFVGSSRHQALAAIQNAGKRPKGSVELSARLSNDVSPNASIHVQVLLPPGTVPRESKDVWLAITEDKLASQVKHGENAGQELSHDGVVRSFKSLGVIKSGAQAFKMDQQISLSNKWNRSNLSVVVFVQEKANRRIVAAGVSKLT